ncbi:YbjN domain-containing protein [Rhizobiales bacterium]|uniref:YbjN domain-containing protein n=1 Tax=Hongsoonwoonella zoysiae TaxID=2821844 RepID=UPI00155F9EFB|nr:YbjN domain-containing protein [Hongsoonwoonella zoysiae]NRG17648.1 YbjN domain-containing protein [Hongsoonwoonella zoysiae]
MSLIDVEYERPGNPVDTIEHIAAINDWSFERSGEDEITISIAGYWCDYHVSFSWMEDLEALHLACAFDLKVPEPRKTEIMRLLALVNEQLWMGHFDLWNREGVVIFRQSLLLAGGADPTSAQIEGLLANALEACERYYQAFQFVVWAGKSASEAVDTALFETAGEA